MRARRKRGAATLLAVLVVAGCSSSGSGGNGSGGHTPSTVTVGDADNGYTIHVDVGDTLVVRLASTYWTYAPARPAGLVQSAPPAVASASTSAGSRCVPGQGCGTMTEKYVARATGQVTIAADRTSCGEALRCTAGAGSFRITLVIS
jgi:hypothetical protein